MIIRTLTRRIDKTNPHPLRRQVERVPDMRCAKQLAIHRHATLDCRRVLGASSVSGRNDRGVSGWAHRVDCELDAEGRAIIVLGWSNDPAVPSWRGGRVYGFVAPSGKTGARLIASPPQAGLAANAVPDPSDLPNNHLAYAVQWFLFALTALVIYGLALRKRLQA